MPSLPWRASSVDRQVLLVVFAPLLRVLLAPVLLCAATWAGRRWGQQVGGWLVALPLTSGPVAWFLMVDHGSRFAAAAAVGMLAGTTSQIAFATAYRGTAAGGWPRALAAGCAGFALSTLALAVLHPALQIATVLVVVALGVSIYGARRRPSEAGPRGSAEVSAPRWDLPARVAAGTLIVLAITALAPVVGAPVAGLLSPLPVFGAVLAVFGHRTHGPAAATAALDGLVLGLAAPAVFFLVLAATLTAAGAPAFVIATLATLLVQGGTVMLLRASSRPATPSTRAARLPVQGLPS